MSDPIIKDDDAPALIPVVQFNQTKVAFDDGRFDPLKKRGYGSLLETDQAFNQNLDWYATNEDLKIARANHSSMDIAPFPMRNLFVVAAQANDTRDVNLPDNTQLIRFSANNNIDFFVSIAGQIQFPIVEDLTGNGVIYTPRDQWFYVKGLKNLSIGLPIINTGVSIMCIIES